MACTGTMYDTAGAMYAYDSKVNMNIPDGVFFKNSANISGGE